MITSFILPSGEEVRIDLADKPLASAYPWSRHYTGSGLYVSCLDNGRRIYLHRMITGSQPRTETHHKDGNWLHCERDNFVVCSRQQNASGFRKRCVRYPSRFRGVGFYKRDNCWRAQIMVNYHQYFLGYHDSEVVAARAYDGAAKIHFNEFAQLNFP